VSTTPHERIERGLAHRASLALEKVRLIDLLGGRVELRSALDEGSEFRLWVPVDARRPSASAVR
jgi:hypothetical protein